MKILLINGSSRPNGCTYTALREIADTLESGGAETEILFLGSGPVRDCTACRTCQKTPGRCVFDDDMVNPIIEKAREADGFVFGTPVYYAHPSGRILSVLDGCSTPEKTPSPTSPARLLPPPAGRHYGLCRCAGQIFHHRPDAGSFLYLLEHGPRQHAGGGAPGRGGNADHAEFGPKPALDGPVHPGGKGRWTPAAPGGERGPDQLHPLKRESPGGISLRGLCCI